MMNEVGAAGFRAVEKGGGVSRVSRGEGVWEMKGGCERPVWGGSKGVRVL